MIEVQFIAPMATVQDLGRDGYWAQGLGRAGAMDALAHRVANCLLGNDEGAATLEIQMTPATFKFTERTAFALVGASCSAKLGERSLPRVWAGVAEAETTLTLGTMGTGDANGARTYLALKGGIDVPEVLGSRSTQLREAFGGFEGRMLKAGDQLRPRDRAAPPSPTPEISVSLPPLWDGAEITVRALPSAEHDSFDADARAAFWSEGYTVSAMSNRQGFRLDGPELSRSATAELRSHGIYPGIVQVPGNGQPIIQLADCATMGGYPKIAAVIEQDLWRIAQAKAGQLIRFQRVDLDGAADAAAQAQAEWSALSRDIEAAIEQQKGWA